MNVAQEPVENPWRHIADMCGLYRGWDLPLLLWPLLWSSLLAAKGMPDLSRTIALILAVLFARSAAWFMYDSQSVALGGLPRERLPLGAVLAVFALCFVIPLGWPGLWIPAAGGFVAAWFSLRRRSFLAEPILALGLTLLPVAAWQIQDGSTGKGFGLLLLTACLWTVSALVSVRKTHRTSDATLAKLAGPSTLAAIFILKAAALVAFWLAGRELRLGVFYLIGLGAAGALTLYQLFLAKQRLDERAAALELWWGMVIFCAIAFHYVCGCKPPIPLP